MTIGTSKGEQYETEFDYVFSQFGAPNKRDIGRATRGMGIKDESLEPLPGLKEEIEQRRDQPAPRVPSALVPTGELQLDPMPNVPSPPIVPKEWPPHPINPTRVSQVSIPPSNDLNAPIASPPIAPISPDPGGNLNQPGLGWGPVQKPLRGGKPGKKL